MNSANKTLSITQVLVCGAAIVTLSMGIRHGFGLWLLPVTQAREWTRETFSFAIAIQNISWGVAGVFAGMVADRFGALRVIVAGAFVYGLGLVGMAYAPTPLLFAASSGVLIGIAQAGTTYAVIYGVIGRNVPAERRSWAMGIAAAAGSFGQFLMVPAEGFLISALGWQQALVVLGFAALLMAPLAIGLREPGYAAGAAPRREQTILQALREAFKYPSFQLLMAGYFVCGFQVVFIGVHMPSYLKDKGLSPQVASYALALIGLFNVFGTYGAGVLDDFVVPIDFQRIGALLDQRIKEGEQVARIKAGGVDRDFAGKVQPAENPHAADIDRLAGFRALAVAAALHRHVDDDRTRPHRFDHGPRDEARSRTAGNQRGGDDDILRRDMLCDQFRLLCLILRRHRFGISGGGFGLLEFVVLDRDELCAERRNLFLRDGTNVRRRHHGSEPARRRDRLKTSNACPHDKNFRRRNCARSRHHHRHGAFEFGCRIDDGLVSGEVRLRGQHVHGLCSRDPRHQFHRKAGQASPGNCFKARPVVEGLQDRG